MGIKRVLVGVDGSPASEAAARWAADLVGFDGEVIAVYATGTALIGQAAASAATGLGMFPHVPSRKEAGQKVLEQWCASFRDSGVAYRAVVADADPVRALLNT